jgi:hypothetical protein
MQAFADFSDSLLSGALLICLSIALGSLPWAFFVLPTWEGRGGEQCLRRCVGLLAAGAVGLALCQFVTLALKNAVLSELLGAEAFVASRHPAVPGRVGARRAGALLAATAWWLRGKPRSRPRWAGVAALAARWPLAAPGCPRRGAPGGPRPADGAHGAAPGRRGDLGRRRDPARRPLAAGAPRAEVDPLWTGSVPRFSRVAVASLLVLAGPRVPLAWLYVGSWGGLIGTATARSS